MATNFERLRGPYAHSAIIAPRDDLAVRGSRDGRDPVLVRLLRSFLGGIGNEEVFYLNNLLERDSFPASAARELVFSCNSVGNWSVG